MTSRERVRRTIRFQQPDKLACDLSEELGFESDFFYEEMRPFPEDKPSNGIDEWGCRWSNIGQSTFGAVKDHPLKEWSELVGLEFPDVKELSRWRNVATARERAGERYLVGYGIPLYDRIHYLRGLQNTWMDIYDNPDELTGLIMCLVEMNIEAIKNYAQHGYDGFYFWDDWGLQDRLMIAPDAWREFWKPAYRQVIEVAHQHDLDVFLHSCGQILDILPDLIEVGLDVIQQDQQLNMGLDSLSRFAGKICFFNPADIQAVLARCAPDEVRRYTREMVRYLATPEGGFIAKYYMDWRGTGQTEGNVRAMCEEFAALRNVKS